MVFDRLAIINTDPTGMQPLEHGGRTLLCNGELYNYRELVGDGPALRTDVEALLHVIPPLGDLGGVLDAVDSLDGDFAFVMVDEDAGEFVVARDRVGVRPLFFAVDEAARFTCQVF